MPSESRGVFTGAGASASLASPTLVAPGPQSYLLIAVATSGTAFSVTAITGGGTGTFVQVAAINSATRRLELWLGYNFGSSAPTNLTITRTSGAANMAFAIRVIDVLTDAATLPSFTVSTGATATSATADSGALTPAAGDILFAACVLASLTADSTARTHTGNAYLQNAGAEVTNVRVETGWGEAVAAVSSKEQWTLAASVEWAAIQVKWTPPAPPTPTSALLLKGLTTQAADAASSY